MPAARKNPRDLTGLQDERLRQENAKALQERSGKIGLVSDAPVEFRDDVVELDLPSSESILSEDGESFVEREIPQVAFRVNSRIEDMTFGAGNIYTFDEGVQYRGPKALYDHLEEKGYIWH